MLPGCFRPAGHAPSLAPRATEAIDPRVPLPGNRTVDPADPGLRSLIDATLARGLGGNKAFEDAMARAELLARAAGGQGSESWVAAQQALSAAIAERARSTLALSDIDALAAQRLQSNGDLRPGDLQAIEAASNTVSTIDRAQARRVAAVQALLGT
jgi:hypothetical protein